MNSALAPQLPSTQMFSLEEVLAGGFIVKPGPLALESQEKIALANSAATILGNEDIVSREVFKQAL